MGTLWFWIVAAMLAAYVVLDGFDLGVGAIYLFVARTEADRRHALQAIGPVWDGNEVWLIAAGGTLFFAFPLLYASAFSGFYLPLIIVLWLLILRGLSIELRGHSTDPLWRTFFDALFSLSSILLIIFFGAALANVLRGVPIGPDHYFFLPLWTNWRTGPSPGMTGWSPGITSWSPGILDWYTVLGGLLALTALSLHGALYLALKTEAELEQRAIAVARKLWPALVVLTFLGIPATVIARPASLSNYRGHPADFLAPLGVLAGLAIVHARSRLRAFFGSCLYLISILVGACLGLFPVLLPAVGNRGQSLTIANSISSAYTLHVGLIWWTFGILLAIFYFCVIYWLFRGKVSHHSEGYGH
jgi:cytochrome d ubiquinol oxidase subunit II